MIMEKKKSVSAVCIYGIKVFFLLCIAFVLFEAYTYRAGGAVEVLPLLFVIFVTLGFLCLGKYFAEKFKSFFTKYIKWLLIGYLLITFVLQISLGIQVRYTPMWDLSAVFDGAITWLEQGNINEFSDYFYYFPNNMGLLLVFKGYFSVIYAVFGAETDYFVAALVLGSVTVTLFRFSVIWISKKLFGVEYAITAMLLLLCCIPLYFASAAFYTDVMSMAAPALCYLLYLYTKEAVSIKKKVLWNICMALVAAYGMEIKFTVIIIVIAVGMEILLSKEWKNFVLMAGIHCVVIMMVFSTVNHIIYPNLLTQEQAEFQNTPYLHWIMMGAQGNGSYNPQDYNFTRSFEDKDERQQALKAEILKRYQELGVQGILDLWKKKTIKCFGDGTYALSDFLDDGPVEGSKWSKWILYSGEKYNIYQTICLGIFVVVMLLMLFGVSGSFHNRGILHANMTALWLAFVGLWIFLMLWETSGRYFSNYLSVMLLSALFGLPHFERFVKHKLKRIMLEIDTCNVTT